VRVALISDVHGNTLGLRAVLAALEREGGADVVCAAGDLVGGGSGTDEVLDLLLARGVRLVRGNAEDYLADLDAALAREPREWRRRFLRARAEWLGERLSTAHAALLRGLPASLTVDLSPGRLFVCHATPASTTGSECDGAAPPGAVARAYGGVRADVVAYGHDHRSHVRALGRKLLVNVASVGSRPEHDGLSAYTLLDCLGGGRTVRQRFVPFDAAEEARRCAAARLPAFADFCPPAG
jgi:predicted phosphodiesterase